MYSGYNIENLSEQRWKGNNIDAKVREYECATCFTLLYFNLFSLLPFLFVHIFSSSVILSMEQLHKIPTCSVKSTIPAFVTH